MPRILIAEDDEPVRALVARALLENGHDVVTAPDGGAALETLAREKGRFDLLLADIEMPVMDGIALARATARAHPDMAIVLMSAFADQREQAHGLHGLVRDILPKPLTVASVRNAVNEALATAR